MLSLISSEISLVPDWTFFVQLGIFLCTVAVLSVFVFRPVLRIIDARKKYTSGADEEAKLTNETSDKLDAEHKTLLAKEVQKIQEERAHRIAKTAGFAEKMIAEARLTAKRTAIKTKEGLKVLMDVDEAYVTQRASEIGKELVSKLSH